MKLIIPLFILLILGFGFFSNKNEAKYYKISINQTKCSSSILIDTFKQSLILLDYNKFDTSEIKMIFKKPYSYHIIRKDPQADSFTSNYKFDRNEIYFYAKGYGLEYYLDYAKIFDNSVKLNFNIEIGMGKEDFFKNIKQKIIQCDSIKITEIGSMSLFIFSNNKLTEIILTTTI